MAVWLARKAWRRTGIDVQEYLHQGAQTEPQPADKAVMRESVAKGSVIGGQTVTTLGLAQTPWIGALIVLVALLLVGLSGRLDKKYQQQPA